MKNDIKADINLKCARASNFELLRIISMMLIVMHHFSVHGGYVFNETVYTFNRGWVQILSGGGRLGVDIFILISGYFLSQSEYKPRKLVKLVLQVTECAIFCVLVLFITGEIQFVSIGEAVQVLKKAILPIPYEQYWFATTYFILYLFSPYLNRLIKSMDKAMHLKLILSGVVIWSIFPTLLNASFDFDYVGWFIILYMIAAYLRLYPLNIRNLKRKSMLLAAGSYLLLLGFVIGFDFISIQNPVFSDYVVRIREVNSLLTLICAVATFLAFQNLKIQSKVINRIAATTFGIYLLHDNPIIRNTLWLKLLHGNVYIGSRYFALYSLAAVSVVFCGCSMLEMIRAGLTKCIAVFFSGRKRSRRKREQDN